MGIIYWETTGWYPSYWRIYHGFTSEPDELVLVRGDRQIPRPDAGSIRNGKAPSEIFRVFLKAINVCMSDFLDPIH
jgi:hypothetical protein